MAKPSYRISSFHQLLIYFTCFCLFASGAGWMVIHTFLKNENAFVVVPHPSEPIFLAIHGVVAAWFLILFGSLLTSHVKLAWKARKNRASGAVFLGLNLLLIATGYGLYYAGGEWLRNSFHTWHTWIGLLFPFIFALHLWLALKKS